MTGFVDLPITSSEEEMRNRVFDALTAAFPGIELNENHLEVVIVEEFVRMLVETHLLTADIAAAIFREYGRKLANVTPIDGAPATATTTWVLSDTDGHVIPFGTLVGYRRTGDEIWGFATVEEVVVDLGEDTALDVVVEATVTGSGYNGVADTTVLELIDGIAWVESVTLTSATAGGVDAETDDEYLDRLAERLRLLTSRPVLPDDFAVLSRDVAGVHRALALDGYNPVDETFDNERMIAIAAVDVDGEPLAPAKATELETYLDSEREVNFVVNVIDPTYTNIDVVFEAVADVGADPAAVEAAAEQAIADYLDPSNWGGGDQSPPSWAGDTFVRFLEVATALNAVAGLAYLTTLTLAKDGGAAGQADIELDGVAPLPQRVEVGGSTVDGTVT
jgi:hypothetical protein